GPGSQIREGERTTANPCRFGILWALLRIGLYLSGIAACLSPRFYPHSVEPAGPRARWGPSFWWGAAISAAISMDQDAERSLPHSDGYAFTSMPVSAPFPLSLHAIDSQSSNLACLSCPPA